MQWTVAGLFPSPWRGTPAWPRQEKTSAVTSAVRLTECAVNDVLGLEAPVKVNQQDASVTLKLPRNLAGEADQVCQTLLAALMVYLVQLQEEYPEHINVMEV